MQLYKITKLYLHVAASTLVLAKTAIVCSQYEQSEMDDVPKCTKHFTLPGEPACNCNKINNCPTVKYHFPRDNQIKDYARYRYYVPQMKDTTICMWVETQDYENRVTSLLSYATSDHPNEKLIFIQNLKIAAASQRSPKHYDTVDRLLFQQKAHICLSFSNAKRQSVLHLNGKISRALDHDISILEGGGDLILAQEQDRDDVGKLDEDQAFNGNITNPMIWPRVLSDDEIRNIATSCQCPQDYAVAFTIDKTEVHGEAYYSIPERCPTL